MAFADEPVGYAGRNFMCGWPAGQQSAADIAERLQSLVANLEGVDAAFGRLRPDPGMRKLRPGDLGPIAGMETSQLADLIDRRGRFDPPRFPAPVSSTGYRVLYRNDLSGHDPSFLTMSVHAGIYGSFAFENSVTLTPNTQHHAWGDPELGIRIMDDMVGAWDAKWACVYAFPAESVLEDDGLGSRLRPWLAWTQEPLQRRTDPPHIRPYPFPFPFDRAGAPSEVRCWRDGELSIWP